MAYFIYSGYTLNILNGYAVKRVICEFIFLSLYYYYYKSSDELIVICDSFLLLFKGNVYHF